MDFSDIIFKRRSIRRYTAEKVSDADLRKLIEFARVAPSGKNGQNLRFCVIRHEELVKEIFTRTAWAGFVTPKRTPVWGKDAPQAFIAVTAKNDACSFTLAADAGAAIQNILLGAVSLGLGSCWIGSFNKLEVNQLLALPEDTGVIYLVALGYPAEEPILEDASDPEHIKYYLDDNDQLHVPKLTADDLTTWK